MTPMGKYFNGLTDCNEEFVNVPKVREMAQEFRFKVRL